MPLLDMPLEKLRNYQGISPCPADIDEYWDNALKEMDAVEHNATFTEIDFPCKGIKFYDMYFTGTKNTKLYSRVAIPENIDGKAPAVLMFHGLSGSFKNFTDIIPYAANGFVVATLDTRGQGGRSDDAGVSCGSTYSTPFVRGIDGGKNDLYLRDAYLDTALLAKIIMGLDCVDETRVGCMGGSQGGGLSLACASLVPSIKKCAPNFPYMSDYKRVWEMDLDKGAYEGLRYFLRHYDPRHERVDEIFETLGYVDIQNITKRIKAEVLMATGLQDQVCPPSTQFAAYNKITSKKDVVIYPDFGHEDLFGHSDIVYKFMSGLKD